MSAAIRTTFEVSDVKRATALLPDVPYKDAVEAQLSSGPVEACSRYHIRLLCNVAYHPVVAVLGASFLYHYPICFSPDTIWLMIIQGVAHHINVHAERLRSRFVRSGPRPALGSRRSSFR